MDNQNVLCYIDEIDNAYLKGRVGKWSRYSTEWSEFSTPLNKEVKQKIKEDVPEEFLLQMILPYWFNRSEMLEIYYTKRHLFKRGALKRLKNECIQIRNDIKVGIVSEIGQLSKSDVVRKAIQGAH